jgi:hypothetical protein
MGVAQNLEPVSGRVDFSLEAQNRVAMIGLRRFLLGDQRPAALDLVCRLRSRTWLSRRLSSSASSGALGLPMFAVLIA